MRQRRQDAARIERETGELDLARIERLSSTAATTGAIGALRILALDDVPRLVAEVRRLRFCLQSAAERFEERDTGVGFPEHGGSLAWAMHRDCRRGLDGERTEEE